MGRPGCAASSWPSPCPQRVSQPPRSGSKPIGSSAWRNNEDIRRARSSTPKDSTAGGRTRPSSRDDMAGMAAASSRRERRRTRSRSHRTSLAPTAAIGWMRAGSNTTRPRRTVKRTAADFVPNKPTLPKLREAAKGCRGCDLWKVGTQTVFGEGPRTAHVLVVGEQPGDQEDKQGRPFVGPAGRILDRAFDAAGIDRDDVYVTNAVKHFKWARDARSKRRIHKTPNASEVNACFPWLENEIALLKPRVIVCLGATAAKALLGRGFRVTKQRGIPVESPWAPVVIATVHPSSVLRAPPGEQKRAEQAFIADIRKVARALDRDRTEKRTAAPASKLGGWSIHEAPSGTSNAPTRSSRRS